MPGRRTRVLRPAAPGVRVDGAARADSRAGTAGRGEARRDRAGCGRGRDRTLRRRSSWSRYSRPGDAGSHRVTAGDTASRIDVHSAGAPDVNAQLVVEMDRRTGPPAASDSTRRRPAVPLEAAMLEQLRRAPGRSSARSPSRRPSAHRRQADAEVRLRSAVTLKDDGIAGRAIANRPFVAEHAVRLGGDRADGPASRPRARYYRTPRFDRLPARGASFPAASRGPRHRGPDVADVPHATEPRGHLARQADRCWLRRRPELAFLLADDLRAARARNAGRGRRHAGHPAATPTWPAEMAPRQGRVRLCRCASSPRCLHIAGTMAASLLPLGPGPAGAIFRSGRPRSAVSGRDRRERARRPSRRRGAMARTTAAWRARIVRAAIRRGVTRSRAAIRRR